MNSFKTIAFVMLLAGLLTNPSTVSAHHPVVSQYDIEREHLIEGVLKLEGVLKHVEIGSPNSFSHALVVDEYGDESVLKIEWSSASTLQKEYSFNRLSIRLNQRIRIKGYLSTLREDHRFWPLLIQTEYDMVYDRAECNAIEKSGRNCQVLTSIPPPWSVLPELEQ